ncbi:MAG: immunoglobulin domain-containing protein, partial [Verrucomicrobiota bacterium]
MKTSMAAQKTLFAILTLTLALATENAGASKLVGLRTDELVLIDTDNLDRVLTLSRFEPFSGIEFGGLIFHKSSQRLYARGYVNVCAPPTVIVEFVLPQGIPHVVTNLPVYFEAVVYVDSLDTLVASRSPSGPGDCKTSELLSLALYGTLASLQQTSLDNDFGVYDSMHDMFYTTDPNGEARLERVDLMTGVVTSLGGIPRDMGDMAFSPTEGVLYALQETDNSLHRIATTAGGSPISVSTIGFYPGPHIQGIAFVPETSLFPTNQPPLISYQPAGQTNYVGEAVRLTVFATGTWPLSYQWRKDGLDLVGATNAALVLASAKLEATGDYTVFVANAFGSVTSAVARVIITERSWPYVEEFQGGVGQEWSHRQTDVTPVGNRRFLGQFGNGTVYLTLNGLPAHQGVTVSFELFIIRSWDGGWAGPEGDIWDLSLGAGPTLLHTTFNNHSG